MKYYTPETFIVGETVNCRLNGDLIKVKVTAVNGSEVKVTSVYGRPMTFRSRLSDGQHVGQFTEEFQAKPDIIFRHMPLVPVKESFLSRVASIFCFLKFTQNCLLEKIE